MTGKCGNSAMEGGNDAQSLPQRERPLTSGEEAVFANICRMVRDLQEAQSAEARRQGKRGGPRLLIGYEGLYRAIHSLVRAKGDAEARVVTADDIAALWQTWRDYCDREGINWGTAFPGYGSEARRLADWLNMRLAIRQRDGGENG